MSTKCTSIADPCQVPVQKRPEDIPLPEPELPLELWEYIFGFLAALDDDQEVLRICTQVCRLMSDLARPHIFRLVLVRFGDSALQFLSLVDDNPSIAGVVRELAFCAPDPIGDAPEPITSPKVLATVSMFVGRFPRLHTVMLMGMYEEGGNSPPELFDTLSRFTTVTRLEILGCKFPKLLLQAYMSTFPALRSLSLNTLAECETDNLVNPPDLPVPKLERVRLRTIEAPGDILPWITCSGSKHLLKSANLDAFEWDTGVVETFLEQVGSTLIDLDLKLVNTMVSGIGCPSTPVNLSKATALQTLTLRTALCDSTIAALPTITSTQLKSLRFTIPPFEDSHLPVYEVLADQIGKTKFPKEFEEICFIFKTERESMDMDAAVVGSLFEQAAVKHGYKLRMVHTLDSKRWWLSMHTL